MLLLREVEHRIRVLGWMWSDDATKKPPKNYPEPIPLTERERDEATPEREKYTALPVDEMRTWLGWD